MRKLSDLCVDAVIHGLVLNGSRLALGSDIPWSPFGRLIFECIMTGWTDRQLDVRAQARLIDAVSSFMLVYPDEIARLTDMLIQRSLRLQDVQLTATRAFGASVPLPLQRLERIASLSSILVRLQLRGCGLQNSDLVYIARLRSLVLLDLRGNADVSDTGVNLLLRVIADASAHSSSSLSSLSSDPTFDGDDLVDSTSSLANLQHINLSLTSVTDHTLLSLFPKFPSLCSFDVSNSEVQAKAMKAFLTKQQNANTHTQTQGRWHILDPGITLFNADDRDIIPPSSKRARDSHTLARHLLQTFPPSTTVSTPHTHGLPRVAWPTEKDDATHNDLARRNIVGLFPGLRHVRTQAEEQWRDGNYLRRFVMTEEANASWKDETERKRAPLPTRIKDAPKLEVVTDPEQVSHAHIVAWEGDRAFTPGTKFGRTGTWRCVKIMVASEHGRGEVADGGAKHLLSSLPTTASSDDLSAPPTSNTRLVSVAERGVNRVARVANVRAKSGGGFFGLERMVNSDVSVAPSPSVFEQKNPFTKTFRRK
ncbi:hypothetical protein M427DRAFT_153265 [Gonapodya prolifera JEL478]|uniref:RNI-like protein n=1 Tax=Gonapodya prolifera (strain JEL478) TaxID=1344416 RepID=A0A139AP69_GONPJ|nr:hypothetical protein M427DRAFT_153265 [Gonapodya prolifera JEL478]|eukprot:KXS18522.1 hypothetical protein M427DRAFT_153265 [Gonapodya prolifera JEL478]